ncbi:MAG: phytoene desaturase family protein, partial [Sphingomonadaceae bacterium]
MTDPVDVVIVGAGHNGMAAAGYLSRAGKKVVVVERMAKVGGMTSSGYMIPEAPEHLVTPCAVELLFARGSGIIEDLELDKYGLRTVDPDPTYAYLDPDGSSIAIFRDPRRTAEDIARINRNDGKAYLEFLQCLDAMMDIGFPLMKAEPGRPDARNLSKMIGSAIRNVKLKDALTAISKGTADQVACERFEHPATIALLLGIAAGAG